MSECFRYVFLKNEHFKSSEEFKDEILQQGMALYEVIRVISGKPVFLEDHFHRLTNSAMQVENNIWLSFEKIKESIEKLVEKNDTKEGNIKLVFHINGKNKTFFAYFVKHYYPNKNQCKNGVITIVHPAERPIPTVKVYNHSLRSKTNDLIRDAEIFEVLLLNPMGNITEGSRSNLFFIKNDELHTAPDTDVLNGIVRGKVIGIAKELKIPIHKHPIRYDDLPNYDAVFITGTSPMVLPVKRINSINYPTSHPLLGIISEAYCAKITEYLK